MQELHYLPRSAARVLASRRTVTIGLLLTEIGGGFFSPLLRGIETGARQAGYDLLHQAPPEDLNIPFITVENRAGAEELVNHLIEVHGRQRIVFLREPEEHKDSNWRERGYREALELHGLVFDPSLVARGGFNETIAYQAVRKLLTDEIAFDAVFAGDDAAHGVLQALLEAGKHLPEQVSLVGFDDLPFSRFMNPPLTTVRAPIEKVGLEAARLLVQVMRGEAVEPKVLLPTEVIIRQSCGCLS